MTLTYVDSVPKSKTRKGSELRRKENCLQGLINRFAKSNRKIARIDVGRNEGYASFESLHGSIRHALKLYGDASIRVVKRGDEIYLVKD